MSPGVTTYNYQSRFSLKTDVYDKHLRENPLTIFHGIPKKKLHISAKKFAMGFCDKKSSELHGNVSVNMDGRKRKGYKK